MSKRKLGFQGFGINRQQTYNFERSQQPPPQRLYVPPSSSRAPHDHYEDTDLDNIDYDDTTATTTATTTENDAVEEVDPLDAFMEGIHQEMKAAPNPNPKEKLDKYRDDDDEDDPMETFLRAKKDAVLTLASDALRAGYDSDEEVYAAAKAVDAGLIDYDSDDNPVVVDKRKIEPIPALDHTDIDYQPFTKDFYDEKPSISGMSEQDVSDYRKSLSIRVSGFDVPRPLKTFEDCGFPPPLLTAIAKQGYEKPTSIQCQALPIVLSGLDIIGIAKTGSGKTAAFVLPMIVHIMDQPELDKGEGPIGVICAPTRELAHQIYLEAKKFSKSYGLRVSAVYGGMSKLEQFKELKAGAEIVVATPGRLIDLLKMKALTMKRATYLVLDEADRMFDLGFEPQIRSIVGQIRPDRQTLLFSATMPRRVEKLAREILSDPVRVTVGEIGMANEDITQVVQVLPSDAEKLPWLLEKLPGMIDEGDVLVFASKKASVDEVESQLAQRGFKVAALHGDKDQSSRMEILQKFKAGTFHVLIATDVAARGLDIKSIKSVVNFDIAKEMDMHVHRIGRTGRAGDKDGVAYTLITLKEAKFAGELVNSLIAAGQNVSVELMDLAMKERDQGKKLDVEFDNYGTLGKGVFTDLQQVQLRAQIFVYGSLMQEIAPNEAHMVSAFGPSCRTWDSTWRTTMERVRTQKSSLQSGARASDSPAIMASPMIPLSSPLWSISTPLRDNLPSSTMHKVTGFQQTATPLHSFQTPPIGSYNGHSLGPSQTCFPSPQTTSFSPSVQFQPVTMTETPTVPVDALSSSPVGVSALALPQPDATLGSSIADDSTVCSLDPSKKCEPDTMKGVMSSEECLKNVLEAKNEAENASVIAANAVTNCEDLWGKLAKEKESGLISESESRKRCHTDGIMGSVDTEGQKARSAQGKTTSFDEFKENIICSCRYFLNTADKEALLTVKGIGRKKAEMILMAQPDLDEAGILDVFGSEKEVRKIMRALVLTSLGYHERRKGC